MINEQEIIEILESELHSQEDEHNVEANIYGIESATKAILDKIKEKENKRPIITFEGHKII